MTTLEARIPSVSAPAPAAVAPSSTPSAPPADEPAVRFQEVLHQVGARLDHGEALLQRASRGGGVGLDAGQLIALQAGIYRHAELVDVAAKVVDRASSTVRTVVQSGR